MVLNLSSHKTHRYPSHYQTEQILLGIYCTVLFSPSLSRSQSNIFWEQQQGASHQGLAAKLVSCHTKVFFLIYEWNLGPSPIAIRFQKFKNESSFIQDFPSWRDSCFSWTRRVVCALSKNFQHTQICWNIFLLTTCQQHTKESFRDRWQRFLFILVLPNFFILILREEDNEWMESYHFGPCCLDLKT